MINRWIRRNWWIRLFKVNNLTKTAFMGLCRYWNYLFANDTGVDTKFGGLGHECEWFNALEGIITFRFLSQTLKSLKRIAKTIQIVQTDLVFNIKHWISISSTKKSLLRLTRFSWTPWIWMLEPIWYQNFGWQNYSLY